MAKVQTFFDDGDIQGYCEVDSDVDLLHIHFKGSNQITDWIIDFLAIPLPFSNEQLGYTVYSIKAKELLKKFIGNHKNILITGYSLGGALATAVAPWVRDTYKAKVSLITLGAPRYAGILWKIFYFRSIPIKRIIIIGDVVPTLPPWWRGYIHCGKAEKVNKPEVKVTIENPFAKHLAYGDLVDFIL